MLITDYAIIKLQRDDRRQWVVLGQCNDIPGECRPSMIYPIVARLDDDGNRVRVPRSHGYGWIEPSEMYAYVKMNFWKRHLHSEVKAVDQVTVTLTRGQ